MTDRTREKGRVGSAIASENYDGRGPAVVIGIDFPGSHQAFVACLDREHFRGFVEMLLRSLGVGELSDLVGMELHALRCWDTHGAMIEGLETLDGKRFTKTAWAREVLGDTSDPLTREMSSLQREISFLTRRIEQTQDLITQRVLTYKAWDE